VRRGLQEAMDRKRYAAFLSYSHADRRVGERLLRKLQTYRLAKRATPQDSRKLGNNEIWLRPVEIAR